MAAWTAVPRPAVVALAIAVVLVAVESLGPLAVPPAQGPLAPLVLFLLTGVVASRAWCRRPYRVGWSLTAAALGAWATRAALLEPDGSDAGVDPSMAVEWLGVAFYSLIGLAVVSLVWSRTRRIEPSLVFDGLIVALTVGATVAFAVFELLLDGAELDGLASGTVAVVGDLAVLLVLVLGVVLVGTHRDVSTGMLAVGLVLLLGGDFAHEIAHGVGEHVHGFSLLSLIGAVVLAAAAWAPEDRRSSRPRPRSVAIVSFGSTAVALTLLSADAFMDEGEIGLVLALGALAMALPRLFLAGRTARQLAVAEQEIRTDQLTGLGNRRRFFDELAARLTAGMPVTVAVADLRGFKYVNDSYGHHAGDEVLRHVGRLWSAMLGPDDVLVRLGGDEFGIILNGGGSERGDTDDVAVERVRALHRPSTPRSASGRSTCRSARASGSHARRASGTAPTNC